jgi:prolyl oligopeptidase PreP (S9A serine peptidase family)
MLKSELKEGQVLILKKKFRKGAFIYKARVLEINEKNQVSIEAIETSPTSGIPVTQIFSNFNVNWHEWELDPQSLALAEFDKQLEELLKET